MVHFIDDRYNLDGYRCIRRKDITLLEEQFDRRDLIERAFRLKNLKAEAPPVVAQANMEEMIEIVQREYGLVTIHRESVNPDECEIGQVRISSGTTYVLRWLDTDARWEPDDRPFKYADVTRLDFGSEYERTLLMVSKDRGDGG